VHSALADSVRAGVPSTWDIEVLRIETSGWSALEKLRTTCLMRLDNLKGNGSSTRCLA